ncbi:hypothetical protein [Paenibacillus sanguinis]|uniref:hypothetical protein n=1 Tax=Paenibacillus sanguinis TaxID=225906 RepID=UPI00038263C3|nr:hypothetical protein [Paenibacillus sanguinis]
MFKRETAALHGKLALSLLLTVSLGLAAGADQAQADTAFQECAGAAPKESHKPERPPHIHGGHIFKDTAEWLNMEPKALIEPLRQGKTLMQIVKEKKGWSEEEYLQRLMEAANRNIDGAVAEGKLDQVKAAQIKSTLPEKLKRIIHRNWQDRFNAPRAEQPQNNKINWGHMSH